MYRDHSRESPLRECRSRENHRPEYHHRPTQGYVHRRAHHKHRGYRKHEKFTYREKENIIKDDVSLNDEDGSYQEKITFYEKESLQSILDQVDLNKKHHAPKFNKEEPALKYKTSEYNHQLGFAKSGPSTPVFNPVEDYKLYRSLLPRSKDHSCSSHHSNICKTPACLLSCTNWVMDIYECKIVEGNSMMGGSNPASLNSSMVSSDREKSTSGQKSFIDQSVILGGGMASNLMDLPSTRKLMTVVSNNPPTLDILMMIIL